MAGDLLPGTGANRMDVNDVTSITVYAFSKHSQDCIARLMMRRYTPMMDLLPL